jgi:hypothetical protein
VNRRDWARRLVGSIPVEVRLAIADDPASALREHLGLKVTCGCREPHPPSSGSRPVLVDQPGKDIGSSNASGVGIGDRDRCFVDQREASLTK